MNIKTHNLYCIFIQLINFRFALVNVKFAVAIIVKNFRIELDESKTVLPLKFDPKAITIEPVGGFHVKFEKL